MPKKSAPPLALNPAVLLAISGGIDSAVLLDVCTQKTTQELGTDFYPITNPDATFHIAHFHHGTPHATDAEVFVRQLAKKYHLPLHIGRTTQKLTSEAAFRTARYTYLNSLARTLGIHFVLTAHHASDQAETILFNAIRGTGLAGLRGMYQSDDHIYRPLLTIPKENILAYAKKHQLQWIEDPSNQDTTYSRNYLRHHIIPQLQKINPRVEEALIRLGELANEAEGFLTMAACQWIAHHESTIRQHYLPLEPLTAAGIPLTRVILRRIITHECGRLANIELLHITEVLTLIFRRIGNKQKKCGPLTFRTTRRDGAAVLTWTKN